MNYIYVVVGSDMGEEFSNHLVTTNKSKAKEERKYKDSNHGSYYLIEVWLNDELVQWNKKGEYESFMEED